MMRRAFRGMCRRERERVVQACSEGGNDEQEQVDGRDMCDGNVLELRSGVILDWRFVEWRWLLVGCKPPVISS